MQDAQRVGGRGRCRALWDGPPARQVHWTGDKHGARYVFKQVDPIQTLAGIARLDIRWVAFATFIVMLQIPLVALRWRKRLLREQERFCIRRAPHPRRSR